MAKQKGRQAKISERLAKVLTMGRSKGRLTYDELNTLLPEDVVSPKEIEELLTLLGKENIEIVDKPNGTSRLEAKAEKESKEDEPEVVDVGQLDDPVKMYLRQMGQISLLTREQELTLAKKIEAAEFTYRDAVLGIPISRREILSLTNMLVDGEMDPEDYSKDDPNMRREELVAQLVILRRRLKKAKAKAKALKVIADYNLTIRAIEWLTDRAKGYVRAVENAERQIAQTKKSRAKSASARRWQLYKRRRRCVLGCRKIVNSL